MLLRCPLEGPGPLRRRGSRSHVGWPSFSPFLAPGSLSCDVRSMSDRELICVGEDRFCCTAPELEVQASRSRILFVERRGICRRGLVGGRVALLNCAFTCGLSAGLGGAERASSAGVGRPKSGIRPSGCGGSARRQVVWHRDRDEDCRWAPPPRGPPRPNLYPPRHIVSVDP